METLVGQGSSRKPWVAVAVLVLAATAGFALVVQLRFPSPEVATAVDDLGEAIAALVAAACCLYATTRTEGRIRLAWALLGASAAAWGAGEVMWSLYEVGLGQDVPYPGWPDVGFVAAIPLAFAGIRAFWGEPRGTAARWRVWQEAVVIAFALTFVAWVLGLRLVWEDSGEPPLERFLDLAYPVGDILIGTILILAIRRATRRRAVRVLALLAGIASLTVADSAFAYLSASGAYTAHGSVLDTGWFAGYLIIAVAAAWPRNAVTVSRVDAPVDLWQLALPWLAVLLTGLCTFALALSGRGLDGFLTLLLGVIVILMTGSMMFNSRDFLSMLVKSRESESALAEVLAHAPVGIARAMTDLTVLDANPPLLALLGQERSAVVGHNLTLHIPKDAQADVFARLGRLLAGAAQSVEAEMPLTHADGRTIWVRWSSTVVRDDEDRVAYILTTFQDAAAQHQAEEAARQSLATLDRLNRLKTDFLQSVSHEFKTALIGIQGFSEFMRDADQLDLNDARGFAADIHHDAERLDRMVTEMIALDRVESTRANMRLEPVDVNALVQRVVAGTRLGPGPTVVTELCPALPSVSGDEEKLAEVMRTLLANALRYSPDGGRITVTTAVTGDVVTVSVRDQGVAARADFDNRLFGQDDLYANNPIRKVVGTELGLGIVRQVVEMHGGRLWVEAVDGGGSEFHFTLPVVGAAEQATPAARIA